MDDRQIAERAIKGSIIDRTRTLFEHDPAALDRDNRTGRMFEMARDELRNLHERLLTLPNETKISAVVNAIVDSEHARDAAQEKGMG
jgi:hypothetical protein